MRSTLNRMYEVLLSTRFIPAYEDPCGFVKCIFMLPSMTRFIHGFITKKLGTVKFITTTNEILKTLHSKLPQNALTTFIRRRKFDLSYVFAYI